MTTLAVQVRQDRRSARCCRVQYLQELVKHHGPRCDSESGFLLGCETCGSVKFIRSECYLGGILDQVLDRLRAADDDLDITCMFTLSSLLGPHKHTNGFQFLSIAQGQIESVVLGFVLLDFCHKLCLYLDLGHVNESNSLGVISGRV
jgi:hypothetical protein